MDKQKQIIAVVIVGVLVLGAGAAVLLRSNSPDDTNTAPPPRVTTARPPRPGAPGAAGMGGLGAFAGRGPNSKTRSFGGTGAVPGKMAKLPGAARRPGGPIGATPIPGMSGVGGAAPAIAPALVASAEPPLKRRKGPFERWWRNDIPPPPVFEVVQPIRLARVDVETPPPPNTEIREVPSRRVSGILSGDGVYAILEGGGTEPEIVRPGSRTADGYRVVAISNDSVTLQRTDGNVTRTQVVELSDVSTTGSLARFGRGVGPGAGPAGAGRSQGGFGRPGGAGGRRGRPGHP